MPSSNNLTPRQSRSVGALLGVHAGDALGATLEFQSHAQIKLAYPQGLRDIIGGGVFGWTPGHATDDTDLTRAVLLAYRDCHAGVQRRRRQDPSAASTVRWDSRALVHNAARYLVCWYTGAWPGREPPGSRPVDVGGATAKGIVNLRDRGPDRPSGAGPGSAGNGSLMRCLPTALFQPDLGLMLRESAAVSALTHDDARCTAACAAYNACVAALVAGAHPDYAVRAAELTAAQIEDAAGIDPGRGPVLAALRLGRALSIPRAAAHGPHKDFFPGKCAGYVLETLTLAIAAVLDPRSLEDVLVDVVRLGADTDTNAAVAGGLLGARDGIDAIPQRWRNTLQFGPEFQRLALDIMSTMD